MMVPERIQHVLTIMLALEKFSSLENYADSLVKADEKYFKDTFTKTVFNIGETKLANLVSQKNTTIAKNSGYITTNDDILFNEWFENHVKAREGNVIAVRVPAKVLDIKAYVEDVLREDFPEWIEKFFLRWQVFQPFQKEIKEIQYGLKTSQHHNALDTYTKKIYPLLTAKHSGGYNKGKAIFDALRYTFKISLLARQSEQVSKGNLQIKDMDSYVSYYSINSPRPPWKKLPEFVTGYPEMKKCFAFLLKEGWSIDNIKLIKMQDRRRKNLEIEALHGPERIMLYPNTQGIVRPNKRKYGKNKQRVIDFIRENNFEKRVGYVD